MTADAKELMSIRDTTLFQMHETMRHLRAARAAMRKAEIDGMYVQLPEGPRDNGGEEYEMDTVCQTLINEVESMAKVQLMAILAPEVRETIYRDFLHTALHSYLAEPGEVG